MSLIACPECGQGVSSAAPTCPHCGYPIAANDPLSQIADAAHYQPRRRPRRGTSPLRLLVIVLVGFGVGAALVMLKKGRPDLFNETAGIWASLAGILMWIFIAGAVIWVIGRGVSRGIDESRRG